MVCILSLLFVCMISFDRYADDISMMNRFGNRMYASEQYQTMRVGTHPEDEVVLADCVYNCARKSQCKLKIMVHSII